MNVALRKFLSNFRFSGVKSFWITTSLIAFIVLAGTTYSSAQYYQRVYASSAPAGDASSTPLLAGIDDREDALAPSGNVQAASKLTVGLGFGGLVTASQNIRFTGTDKPTAGTPVTLKIETGGSLVGIANSIEIVATLNGAVVSKVISDSDLLNLLGGGVLSGGKNVYEVTFVPKNNSNTNVAYDGVRLKVTTFAGVGIVAKFYHAFWLRSVTSPVACDAPVDVLYGVDGSIATLGAGVTNPYKLVTGVGATAKLNTGITVGGNISETVVFSGKGSGDVEIIVSIPPALISLTLLNNITVKALDGAVEVGSKSLGSLIGLDLLGLFNAGNQLTFRFPTTAAFDRVVIETGGVVSALSSLNIHSIRRVLPVPTVATSNYTIYAGQSATLMATSLNASDILTWYNSSDAVVGTGTSIVVTPPATTTYSVVATLSASCNLASSKAIATVTVLPLPTFTNPNYVIETNTYVPASGIAITATGTGPYAYSDAIDLPNGLVLNPDGKIVGTPAVGTAGTVTFRATVKDTGKGGITVATAKTFTIVVYPKLTLTGGPYPSVLSGALSYSSLLSTVTSSVTLGGKGAPFYLYSLTSPTLRTSVAGLPAGFELSSTGTVISLLPVTVSQIGEYTFTIYVTDGVQIASAPFTLEVKSNPLPVVLTNFKVSKEGQTALISWSTTAESNSDHFEIQHSLNGNTWNRVGLVDAKGESSELNSYSFTDRKPSNGSNLYRLKMVDADGTYAFSTINNIEFNVESIVLYPNPTVDKLVFEGNDVELLTRIQVYSVSGKILYDQSKTKNSEFITTVDVKNFPAGIYLVRLTKTDGTVMVHKIVKQ